MRFAAYFALLALVVAGDPSSVDQIRSKFYVIENNLWKNVLDPEWKDVGFGGDIELTKAFTAFDKQIESLPKQPRPQLQYWLWTKATEKIQLIDGFYSNFIEFVSRQSAPGIVPSPMREWLDLTEVILTDPKHSVQLATRKLGDMLKHGDLFRVPLQEDNPDICHLQLSTHQLIFDMYNTVALTEIKGYAMMQFSYMLLKIYGQGNYTQEANLTRERYAARAIETAESARAALMMAPKDIYRCDPQEHIEGETFDQVTRLLQGYLENEVDLNSERTCKEDCPFYTLSRNYGCKFENEYCSKQPVCRGRIIDCTYVDSDMTVCPARDTSQKRYDWIEYENGRSFGKVDTCNGRKTKVDSWWRWLFWHCSYCMCLCDDSSFESHRYFSLWMSVADVKNNKVLTGLKLVKYGRVFHLQIMEGTLGPRGEVTPGDWVPVQKFDPEDEGLREGEDYHQLTYERRAVDLDELEADDGHILTGVRFRLIGAHLHFEIRSTPFNYTTGKMYPEKSVWKSNDNTEGSNIPRSKLELFKPDLPTRSIDPLPIDSKHNQYVEFVNSDFEADAAQSTVPFVDVQPVLSMGGNGLAGGAGIYHRGARGSGGFLAVKLFSYDYSKHLQVDKPPPPPVPIEDNDDIPNIVNK